MSRLDDLYEYIDCIEDEIFLTHIALGDFWLSTDDCLDLYDLLDDLYFELELLELVNTDYIRN